MNLRTIAAADMLCSSSIWKIWMRNFTVWRRFIVSYSVWHIAEPLLYIFAIGFGLGSLVGKVGNVSYIEFFAPAMLATTVMYTSCFTTTYESFNRLKVQKIFAITIITPTKVSDIVAGEIIWAATKAIISGACVSLILVILKIGHAPLVMVALLTTAATGLMFSSIGLFVSSIARDYDDFTYFFSVFISPMFLFSGTFFPIDILPGWAKTIALFLPLTHAVRIIRQILNNSISYSLIYPLIYMLFVTLVFYALSVVFLKKRLIL